MSVRRHPLIATLLIAVFLTSAARAESFSQKLVSCLGKNAATVEKVLGAGTHQKLPEYDYLAAYGATEALFYYGKKAMPNSYLKGLESINSMTVFFGPKGGFIGLNGVSGTTTGETLSHLAIFLGQSSGRLKLGKKLLSKGKTNVYAVDGSTLKIYAAMYGANPKRPQTPWVSRFPLDPKYLTQSV